jgi:hypothetical protein
MGNARKRLNIAHFNGCLLVAVLFGLIAGSWAVFWVALVVTLFFGVYRGEIRLVAGKH